MSGVDGQQLERPDRTAVERHLDDDLIKHPEQPVCGVQTTNDKTGGRMATAGVVATGCHRQIIWRRLYSSPIVAVAE